MVEVRDLVQTQSQCLSELGLSLGHALSLFSCSSVHVKPTSILRVCNGVGRFCILGLFCLCYLPQSQPWAGPGNSLS
jgi:hypothetical protein